MHIPEITTHRANTVLSGIPIKAHTDIAMQCEMFMQISWTTTIIE